MTETIDDLFSEALAESEIIEVYHRVSGINLITKQRIQRTSMRTSNCTESICDEAPATSAVQRRDTDADSQRFSSQREMDMDTVGLCPSLVVRRQPATG